MIKNTDIIIRIILACILGGLVGMERESINRPAGFRTHILVCLGSTIVMLNGIFLLNNYHHYTNLDPARLGAQVISGIGFLGAGTILKEGLSIKGLTTAASLWAVACIGLAIGSGFYLTAILSTFLVFIILLFFSKFEKYISRKHNELSLKIITLNKPGQIGKIGTKLGKMNISITNINMKNIDDTKIAIIVTVKVPRGTIASKILENLSELDDITSVECLND
ncbi:putative Mg2+ transporter-C (MgtC) family protein [Caminicella sporogenes DSM 14501]|uniref:Putative Mg2+ transporter-C (MgtC) family protein n=2 Tax=Caminicella TaxID=166484 RepID=A0A1M6MIV4_9FIRM|nr:MgtC/SapB family protein [Caminicella sporogenes]RKD27532.1 methyltransferase [Caminicella sporogenes]SHJ83377.1 putative Mg2+ transporter-C (MgtC) family protein [Caminicella sporogenes DSM 14501]